MEPKVQNFRNPINFGINTLINRRYKIISTLGHGHFATVFKVADAKEMDAVKACKISPIADDPQWRHELELSILKKLDDSENWPELYDEFTSKKYKFLIISDDGENIGSVLSRNKSGSVTNENSLRLCYKVYEALVDLHEVGYVHRNLSRDSVLVKLQDGDIKVTMSGLRMSAKLKNTEKYKSTSWFASVHSMKGLHYTTHDDFISMIYMVSEFAGFNVFPTWQQNLIQAKSKFHSDPFAHLSNSHAWIGKILKFLDEMKEKGLSDMRGFRIHFETAIADVAPESRITYRIVDDKLKLD